MKSVIVYDRYTLYENGDIENIKTGKLLKNNADYDGYALITLYNGFKGKTHKVHRLVAENFILNPDNKPEVNHIDGNKQNNNVSNLEWVTRIENARHSVDVLGKGQNHVKIKRDDFPKIFEMYQTMSCAKIARIYKVNRCTIHNILSGKRKAT